MRALAGEALDQVVASEVGKVIELLRRKIAESGLSQKQIERGLGWGEGYLSQILTGKVDLKLQHFFRVAAALDCSVPDLLRQLYGTTATMASPVGRSGAPRERRWTGGEAELRNLVAEVVREHFTDVQPEQTQARGQVG